MQEHVLYIPKVENALSNDYIKQIFSKLGTVKKINEIQYTKYKKIFVHILLNTTEVSIDLQSILVNKNSVKLVYSMPWYWTCYEYSKTYDGPNPNIMAEL
jgi:hypothetical protein